MTSADMTRMTPLTIVGLILKEAKIAMKRSTTPTINSTKKMRADNI